MFPTSPQPSDARVNREMNARNIRLRPRTSLSRPAMGNPVMIPSE